MKNELARLAERCKGSVSVDFNPNRDSYQLIEQYFNDMYCLNHEVVDFNKYIEEEVGLELYENIIENNVFIIIQFYPITPIGSYTIYHYDLDEAVELCHKILDDKEI